MDADDVADAIVTCADDTVHRDRTRNVGSGIGRSVIERITGRRLRIEPLPECPVDVPRIVLDCSLI
jgi:nucleoside-diphosphate-sugar epimerase